MKEMTTKTLRAAAQAVVERWDTPKWKDAPATAGYIAALRDALAADHSEKPLDMATLKGQRMGLCSLLRECLPVIDALMQMPGDDDSDARLNGLAGRIMDALSAIAEEQVKGGES